jgi:membrane protein YdbS with pleckstrin-like domain
MNWRARLLAWLRVPHEPSAPPGDERVQTFLAAPNYFRYRVVLWSLRQLGFIWALLFYFGLLPLWLFPFRPPDIDVPSVTFGFFTVSATTMYAIFRFFEALGLIVYALQMIVSALILRLDFEQRWYIVSDRSLRIREGLVRLNEKTMTFANVQHVGIKQNPIQRLLGIADVEVRTAGGGVKKEDQHAEDLHIGYLRGVSNAEEIRDVIQDRLRRLRDAGLGDPDDAPALPAPDDLLEAANALRAEARALRAVVVP